MDMNKLLPLMVLAAIGWHSKGAFQKRIANISEMQHSMVVESDMGQILRQAKIVASTEAELSIPNLRTFVAQHVERGLNGNDPSIDPWGRPYRHDLRNGRLTIRSAGADTRWGTDDDIERSETMY